MATFWLAIGLAQDNRSLRTLSVAFALFCVLRALNLAVRDAADKISQAIRDANRERMYK